MEVSSQLHAPATLPPWYPLDRRLGGPQGQYGCSGEEEKDPNIHRNQKSVFLLADLLVLLLLYAVCILYQKHKKKHYTVLLLLWWWWYHQHFVHKMFFPLQISTFLCFS